MLAKRKNNVAAAANTLPDGTTPSSLSKNIIDDDPNMKVVKNFLSRILASPDARNDPSLFKIGTSSSKIKDFFVEIFQLERKNATDEKKQKSVSVAADINIFTEYTWKVHLSTLILVSRFNVA